MTWLGNSFLSLKDQISSLTREALAEVDGETEQPKFIPAEKFNRLLGICEEKENQICLLQLEIDALRGNGTSQSISSSVVADGKAEILLVRGNGNEKESGAEAHFPDKEGEETSETNRYEDDNKKFSRTTNSVTEYSPLTGNDDELDSHEKQIQNALQKIENVGGKNRLYHLQFALKEIKSMYEAEKLFRSRENYNPLSTGTRAKLTASDVSFPGSKNPHGAGIGTDETMSNDSERSDDSLLNDFEILKPRSSCKCLDEFALSNTVMPVSTRLTRSVSTQCEYEFSYMDKNTQTDLTDREADSAEAAAFDAACRIAYYVKKSGEFEQLGFALRMNSQLWDEVFAVVKSSYPSAAVRDDDVCGHEAKDVTGGYEMNCLRANQSQFWIELNEIVAKNNETLKNFVMISVDENELWKQFYRSVNENEGSAKHEICDLLKRESSLEESIRLNNTSIVEHVNELTKYSRKLENFNCSLNEVSDEILDQTIQLGSLYEELKELNETKELLRKENARLTALVEKLEAMNRDGDGSRLVTTSIAAAVDEHKSVVESWPASCPSLALGAGAVERDQRDGLKLEETIRYDQLASEHDRLTGHCLDLKQQLCKCADQIDSYKNEAVEWQNYCELARKECDAKTDLIASQTKQAETSRKEIEFLSTCITEIQTHCERLREEIALKDARMSATVDERERFKEETALLRKRFALYKTDELRVQNGDSETTMTAAIMAPATTQDELFHGVNGDSLQNTGKWTSCRIDEIAVGDCEERTREFATKHTRGYDSEMEAWRKSRPNERTDEKGCSTDEKVHSSVERMMKLESEICSLKSQLEMERKEVISKEARIIELNRRNDSSAYEIRALTSTIRALDERRYTLRRSIAGILLPENECDPRRLRNTIEAVAMCALEARTFEYELGTDLENECVRENEAEEWRKLVEYSEGLSVAASADRVDKSSNTEEATDELDSQLRLHERQRDELERRVVELEHSLATEIEHGEMMNSNTLDMEDRLSVVTSERDQVIASLKEKHSENLYYHNELQKVHAMFTSEAEKNNDYIRQIEELKQQETKNNNAETELKRLREHLLCTEQSYTNELLHCEEQIKELRCKLTEYEELVESINAVQTSVNVRANQMTESLQSEMKTLAEEKNRLTVDLNHCEGELQKYIQDTRNLKFALDLFHRNKDSEVFQATEKLQNDVTALRHENRVLGETILLLQTNVKMLETESSEKMELRSQIERKTKMTDELETQSRLLQIRLAESEAKIVDLEANAENSFKLNLLKNIVLRYITSNTDSTRSQALQILAEVLDFSIEERRRIKLPTAGVDGKLRHDNSPTNHSLIDEFIRFVEKESDPKGQSVSKENSNASLFSVPSSLPDVMLPALSQLPVGLSSGHILKDVLQ